MPLKNLAVETLRKLLNNEIKLRQKKFLIQSRSFAEMLEESIRKYQNRAIEAAAVVEELIQLAKQMREANKRGENLKLSDDELALALSLPLGRACPFALRKPPRTPPGGLALRRAGGQRQRRQSVGRTNADDHRP